MQYKGIKPRILAEKAVDSVGEWQVMCFGGRAELLLADRRENGEICRAVFGRDLKPLRFAFNNPPPLGSVPPPAHAKELISLAEKCAAGFSFIRVDFCETEEGRVLFCGISFTPGMGIGIFVPKFYDYVYGAEIALPARAGGITERRKQK